MNSKTQEKSIVTGVVIEALPNAIFRVKIDSNFKKLFPDKDEILGYLSGKMRIYHIKVLVGDKVQVELNLYDKIKGRIVKRL